MIYVKALDELKVDRIKRPKEEIDNLYDHVHYFASRQSKYPTLSYEEGLLEMLRWLTEEESEYNPMERPRGHRDNPLESVDKVKYDSFDVIGVGKDEYGPYWLASVEKEGKRFLTGNYYCV